MFDKDTLIISYDEKRGEPRGSRKRGADPGTLGLGHCIDCTLCVQVCPTGIDIRDGLQYECIACAACIDACDSVMDKMNYPRGLVRYSTEHSMEKGETRILRPRVFVYAALLLLLVGGLVTSMATRTPIILDVIRDRNFLYRELPDGGIENIYTLKVINQRDEARNFRLTVDGVPGIEIDGVSGPVAVDGSGVLSLPVRVRAPADSAYGIMNIWFTVTDVEDPSITMTEDSRFLGPTP
jgi:cytochrome c oxidase accessory protein FixG